MKYLVYNQSGELVARCEYATVAALLVLALSDGMGDGASIRNHKNLMRGELFVYKHSNDAMQSASVIASRVTENEKLLPGYRLFTSLAASQQPAAVAG